MIEDKIPAKNVKKNTNNCLIYYTYIMHGSLVKYIW